MISRRDLTLAGAGLLAAGCVSSRPQVLVNLATPEPQPEGEPTASLDTRADVSRRITVPVRINGAGPFDFVVDTGANRTVIAAELAAELRLPSGGLASVHGVAGVEPSETALVATLQADAITARDLRAPALPRARLGADGLLGVDVLRDRRVLINLIDRKLTIAPDRRLTAEVSSFDLRREGTRSGPDLGERISVPARYRFGQLIIIGVRVSGRAVTAFVDSGSQSTVGNEPLRRVALAQGRNAPQPVRLRVPVLSATGQTAEGEIGVIPEMRIGGMTIRGMGLVFADLHVFDIWDLAKRPSLMLGMDVLGRFNAIELNYARREIAFYLPHGGKGR